MMTAVALENCHREFRINHHPRVLDCKKAMALFDPPSLSYPTRWKDFSLDNKLAFVYFGCMTVLFANGDALSVKQELLATMILVAILLSLSIRYRRKMNWRWPGVQTKGVLTAVGILVVAGIFAFGVTPLAPPLIPVSCRCTW
jgi:hypothetical protein